MQIRHHVLALVCIASLSPACAMPGPLPGDAFDEETATTLEEDTGETHAPEDDTASLSFVFTIDGSPDPTTIEAAAVLELGAAFEPGDDVDALEFWVDGELIFDSAEAPHQAWWMAASAAQNGLHRFVARASTADGRYAEAVIELDLALPAAGKTMWSLEPSQLGRPTRALAQLGSELAILDEAGVRRMSADGLTRWRLDLPFQPRAMASTVSTLHVVGVDAGELVDARVSAAGELLELVELGPAPDGLAVDAVDADLERIAVAGTSAHGPWLGVFGTEGTPIWSNALESEAPVGAGRSVVVLAPGGSFALVDVVGPGDDVAHAELQRHDSTGSLEFSIAVEPASLAQALVLDGDETIIVGTRDGQGNALLTHFSTDGLPLGQVDLHEGEMLALGRWRGHEGVQVAIGGSNPSVGRIIDDAAVWGVEVDAFAGMQPLSLVVDDLGYTFLLMAEDGEGNEPMLLQLHP